MADEPTNEATAGSGTGSEPQPTSPLPKYRNLRPFKKGQSGNPAGINGYTKKKDCIQITYEEVWEWQLPPRQRVSLATAIGAELPKNLTFGQTIAMMTYLKAMGQIEIVEKIQGLLKDTVSHMFAPGGPMASSMSGAPGSIPFPPAKMEFRFVTVKALKDAEQPLSIIDTGAPDELDMVEPPKNGDTPDSGT